MLHYISIEVPVICINPDIHKITTMILKIINTVTLFPRHRNWRHPVKYVITNDIRKTIRRERRTASRLRQQYQIKKRVATLSEHIIGSTMPGCRGVALIHKKCKKDIKFRKKRWISTAVDDSLCTMYKFYFSSILISWLYRKKPDIDVNIVIQKSNLRSISFFVKRVFYFLMKKRSMPNRCARTRSHNLSYAAPLICHFTTSSQSILDWYKNHNEKTTMSRSVWIFFAKHVFSRAIEKKEHSESPRSRVIAIKRTSNRTVKPAVFTMGTMTMHRCNGYSCEVVAAITATTSTTTRRCEIPDWSHWQIQFAAEQCGRVKGSNHLRNAYRYHYMWKKKREIRRMERKRTNRKRNQIRNERS